MYFYILLFLHCHDVACFETTSFGAGYVVLTYQFYTHVKNIMLFTQSLGGHIGPIS